MGGSTEERLASLAARQHGVVSRSQLLELGLTPRQVQHRVATGRLRRLHRGVYGIAPMTGPLEPRWAREMAAVLVCGPDALLGHRSAGGLWGLRPASPAVRPPEVVVRDGRRAPAGVRVRRTRRWSPGDGAVHEGIPVTSVTRTLADLSEILPARVWEKAAARAERAGLIDSAGLAGLAERQRGRPGAAMLRTAVGHGRSPDFTRSEAEERMVSLIRGAGLPAPRLNVRIRGYEVDLLWRSSRVVVEVDGFEHHRSRTSFERDRRRDAVLAVAGFQVLRVTWRQLVDEPTRVVAQIAQAIGRRDITT